MGILSPFSCFTSTKYRVFNKLPVLAADKWHIPSARSNALAEKPFIRFSMTVWLESLTPNIYSGALKELYISNMICPHVHLTSHFFCSFSVKVWRHLVHARIISLSLFTDDPTDLSTISPNYSLIIISPNGFFIH